MTTPMGSKRSQLKKLQKKFDQLVASLDDGEDEDAVEEIGMLEDKIDRLITAIEVEEEE